MLAAYRQMFEITNESCGSSFEEGQVASVAFGDHDFHCPFLVAHLAQDFRELPIWLRLILRLQSDPFESGIGIDGGQSKTETGIGQPVCGELLILGELVIRHTQVSTPLIMIGTLTARV